MSKVNENGFESDEQEQFYREKLREQAEEDKMLEECYYVSWLEERCREKDTEISTLKSKLADKSEEFRKLKEHQDCLVINHDAE